MRFRLLLLLPALVSPANELERLQDEVRNLIDLQRTLSHEQAERREEKQIVESEADLLARQRDQLRDRTAELRGRLTGTEQRRAELARRESERDALVAALTPALEQAETELAVWRNCIPDALRPPSLDRLDPKAAAPARLQAVLTAWAGIETLQNGIHTGSWEIEGRVYDIVFLGLARGYAVSPDDGRAGHAGWNGTAWQWTWDAPPEAVRAAFDAARGRELETADLPLIPRKGAP